VILMPERAVYWPARRTLLVADLHLGKPQTFRAAGIPVPDSVQDEQLARLSLAITRTQCRRVMILGDLLHASPGLTPDMIQRVARWRRGHTCTVVLVPGNHDRSAARVAEAWDLEVLAPTVPEPPFAFTHEPREHDGLFTWCGHLHPALRLTSSADAVKLPCFWVRGRLGVLPAFGRFAAGASIAREPGDRVFAIAEGDVLAL
jgi:DNA ligase-associated metallophosphoesterase